MKLSLPVVLTFFLSFVLCMSCKKGETAIDNTKLPIIIPSDTSGTDDLTVIGRTVSVGTGTGKLSIDGNTLEIHCNDLIKIKGGSYSSIEIKNISAADGCGINIKNDGVVELSGNGKQMRLSNLKNVSISGNGTPGIDKGFVFKNNSGRAIELDGNVDYFTFQNAYFQDIKNYLITYNSIRVYNGTDNSYSKDLKFLNIECSNTGSLLYFPAIVNSSGITGLIKNIEIANIIFTNSPEVSSVVNLGAAENYDVHNNFVKNINSQNNNHNGIFQLNGNGKFHNNQIRNHQGNAIRSWLFSVGTATKEVLIYNNIVFDSKKYSAFEVQGFSNLVVAGITSFANAKIFNNTCGSLNLSKDWVGVVVDVYDLRGGKCEVFNNLAFNFPAPGNNNIWSQQSPIGAIANNNLYFSNYIAAGIKDELNFEPLNYSPVKNSAVTNEVILTEDYYGKKRATSFSIGAVE